MADVRPPLSSSRLLPGDIAKNPSAIVTPEALEEREQELRGALAEAEERAAHPVVDEATLTTSLGQHSAQILRHAHEEAARTVAQAQERAATLLRETQSELDELQAQTESSAAERVVEVE